MKASFSFTMLALKFSPCKKMHQYEAYYTLALEYDARKAGQYFTYGMLKSYANDPLINEYPLVKKMLDKKFKVYDKDTLDKELSSILKGLDRYYNENKFYLKKFVTNINKLAIKGKLPSNKNSIYLCGYLLTFDYNKDNIKTIIENNINKNKSLAYAVNFYALYTCPKEDLKEFQDLYVTNALKEKKVVFPNARLTVSQNQQLVSKMVELDQLNSVNTILKFNKYNYIFTDDFNSKLLEDVKPLYDNSQYPKDLQEFTQLFYTRLNDEDKKVFNQYIVDHYKNQRNEQINNETSLGDELDPDNTESTEDDDANKLVQ